MNNDVIEQLYSLIIYLISGIGIGLLFDIFRVLRKTFKTSNFVTYIEDLLFWIITGIFLIFIVFVFSNGQLRLYNFIGMLIGIIIYILIFSKIFIKINVNIIKFIKKIIYKMVIVPLIYIWKFLLKLLKPITFFVINLKKHTKKQKNIKIKEGF
ncbi:MAG: spore cortex biosynthesis protein YabQ [Clostridia bacterium]|nr:spore cortex biosynthesis protein YabQ [Clostridia bacterium]